MGRGFLIGHGVCRVLALHREPIVGTHAWARGSFDSAASSPFVLLQTCVGNISRSPYNDALTFGQVNTLIECFVACFSLSRAAQR